MDEDAPGTTLAVYRVELPQLEEPRRVKLRVKSAEAGGWLVGRI